MVLPDWLLAINTKCTESYSNQRASPPGLFGPASSQVMWRGAMLATKQPVILFKELQILSARSFLQEWSTPPPYQRKRGHIGGIWYQETNQRKCSAPSETQNERYRAPILGYIHIQKWHDKLIQIAGLGIILQWQHVATGPTKCVKRQFPLSIPEHHILVYSLNDIQRFWHRIFTLKMKNRGQFFADQRCRRLHIIVRHENQSMRDPLESKNHAGASAEGAKVIDLVPSARQ